MLLVFLFSLLGSSFNIKKGYQSKIKNLDNKDHYSINLNNVYISKTNAYTHNDNQQCDYSGPTVDTTTIDISNCKESLLTDLNFKVKPDGSLIKIENLELVLIGDCKFDSDSQISQSILIEIINTNIEIDKFAFNFSKLSNDQYLLYPILNFIGDSSLYNSTLSIEVSYAHLGQASDNPNQHGGIIKAINYNLNIKNTIIMDISVSDNAQKAYIVKFSQSIPTKNCTFSLEESAFADISSSQFIIESNTDVLIKDSTFERFHKNVFVLSCPTASFEEVKFSNYDLKSIAINTTEWHSNTNYFDKCTFEHINSVAVVLSSGENYFFDCHFLNNTNDQQGSSAISAQGTETSLYIVSSHFKKNSGLYKGGAIFCSVKNIEIDGCEFIENFCQGDFYEEGQIHQGGSIHVSQTTRLTLTKCNFTINHASTGGGAVFIDHNSNAINVKVSDCFFINCSASFAGGAVHLTDGIGEINDCYFKDCRAFSGGAVFSQNSAKSDTNMTNCIFDHCSGYEGGCVYCTAGRIILDKSVFENNLDDFIFEGNGSSPYPNATLQRGHYTHSFILLSIDDMQHDPVISDCTFSRNVLHAIDVSVSGTLSLTNCLFEDYKEKHLLDLSYVLSKGTERGTIISDCTFQNCGTMAVYSEKYNTTFINCTFKNNTNTKSKGPGALHIFDKGHFSIYNCTFIGNVGSMNGGALIVDSANIVELDNLTFINNSVIPEADKAQDFGGALFVSQNFSPAEVKIVTISNCYFEGNHAQVCGGGIYCNFVDAYNTTDHYCDIPIVIENCQFVNCSAAYKGGGIGSGMAKSVDTPGWVNGDIVVNNCFFKECHAKYGGGLFSHDETEIGDEETNITSCVFDSCYGEIAGSCIYSRSYLNAFSSCTFQNCVDGSIVVFIEMDEKHVSPAIIDCRFIGNKNQQFHFVSEHSLSFDSCLFDGLSSEKDGGAIRINSDWKSDDLRFNNCTFSGDKSLNGNGGAVYYSKDESQCPKVAFNGCFFNDLSSLNGGAIYISTEGHYKAKSDDQSFDIVFNESSFTSCNARDSGGAIYAKLDSNTAIENCIFHNTKALSKGSSLFVDLGAKLRFTNNVITKDDSKLPAEVCITGGSASGVLEIEGGCFQALKGDTGSATPDFLYFDSEAAIKFSSNSCFSGSQEESVYISKHADIDSKIFNCNECKFPPLPTFTPTPETETQQPFITETETLVTETQQPETETKTMIHTETETFATETQQRETESWTQQSETETETMIHTETETFATDTQQPETATDSQAHSMSETQIITETQQPETVTETQPHTISETHQPTTTTQQPAPVTETQQPTTDSSPTELQTPTSTPDGGDSSAAKIKKLSTVIIVLVIVLVLLILGIVIFAITYFVRKRAMQNPYRNADRISEEFASQSSIASRSSINTPKSENFNSPPPMHFQTQSDLGNAYVLSKLNPDPFLRDFEENI